MFNLFTKQKNLITPSTPEPKMALPTWENGKKWKGRVGRATYQVLKINKQTKRRIYVELKGKKNFFINLVERELNQTGEYVVKGNRARHGTNYFTVITEEAIMLYQDGDFMTRQYSERHVLKSQK